MLLVLLGCIISEINALKQADCEGIIKYLIELINNKHFIKYDLLIVVVASVCSMFLGDGEVPRHALQRRQERHKSH